LYLNNKERAIINNTFQLATQITIEDPNGILEVSTFLQLVLQDNVGKSSQTTTIIKKCN